ncbi:MAG: hypothetical protein LBO05_09520 [Deltaproteobacteria bacterium]|nr:hypothetical protein [Deltaproteobacteria bacterium]
MKKGCHCGSLCHAKSMPSIKINATQKGATIRGGPLRVKKEKLGYVKKVKVAAIWRIMIT